jgi:hypothetical protein
MENLIFFALVFAQIIFCDDSLSQKVLFHGPMLVEVGGMQNIKISFQEPVDGQLSLHYGSCDMQSTEEEHHRIGLTHIGRHQLAKRHSQWTNNQPTRFVWLPPENVPDGGCLHAFNEGELLGTSEPVSIMRKKMRRGTFADVADPQGPWFDGVEYLKMKAPDEIFVAQTKEKTVGIIGGGISGLMTAVSLGNKYNI